MSTRKGKKKNRKIEKLEVLEEVGHFLDPKQNIYFCACPSKRPKPRWWQKENVFLSRLELIGLIYRLKISEMSKNAFFLKSSRRQCIKHTNSFLRAAPLHILRSKSPRFMAYRTRSSCDKKWDVNGPILPSPVSIFFNSYLLK